MTGQAGRIAELEAEAARSQRLLWLALRLAKLATQGLPVESLVRGILEDAVPTLEVDVAMIHIMAEGELRLAGLHSPVPPTQEALDRLQRLPLSSDALSTRAVREGRTVATDALHWPSATADLVQARKGRIGIAAPLSVEDRVIGSICCVRRNDRPFLPVEQELIESCAAHIGVAIEQARLFEAERVRARDLALINELGTLVATRLDLPDLLDTGVRQISLLTSVPHVFLLLLEEDDLRVAATTLPAALGARLPRGSPSISWRSVEERRAVIVNDAASDEAVSQPVVARFSQHALLAVPLLARGEPLGVIVLAHTSAERKFGPAEVDRAVAMANQLAAAISNARLFDDLRQSYERLASAQQQLVKRERMAALGELAAVMAHEIRNPLAVIFNSLATLRRQPPQAAMLLDIVAEEAERLNRIVSELLDFARPGEPHLVEQSLEPVLGGAAEAAQRETGCRIALDIEGPLVPLPLDGSLMRHALMNLISNAAQARPGGAVLVRAFSRDEHVFVEVTDEGPGIPPELLQQIFQPFFTTRAQGTGLSLAIVKRIVEAHGGQIDFRPAQPRGTTFVVRLPIP